jgi:predicted NUDIX family NTP pyrophosphohydrolase
MKLSAGLLLYRIGREQGLIEVLLGHPGGPYFTRKDEGHWTVPKGLIDEEEDDFQAARREFLEETGMPEVAVPVREQECLDLGEVSLRGRKRIRVWSFAGECDPARLRSNTFELEWPPRSGRRATFPEIDRYQLLPLAAARHKIHPAQRPLLERLEEQLATLREEPEP